MRDALITSALLQLTLGVWLGWVVLGFAGGRLRVGPFVARRATLQCHLDNIMMGGLQLGVAAAVADLPKGAVVLLLFGSWVNPQLFLATAIGFSGGTTYGEATPPEAGTTASPRSPLRMLTRAVRFASFGALSIAYPWLALAHIL